MTALSLWSAFTLVTLFRGAARFCVYTVRYGRRRYAPRRLANHQYTHEEEETTCHQLGHICLCSLEFNVSEHQCRTHPWTEESTLLLCLNQKLPSRQLFYLYSYLLCRCYYSSPLPCLGIVASTKSALCSLGPMFPRSTRPQMTKGSYVPSALCSPGPKFTGAYVLQVRGYGVSVSAVKLGIMDWGHRALGLWGRGNLEPWQHGALGTPSADCAPCLRPPFQEGPRFPWQGTVVFTLIALTGLLGSSMLRSSPVP